MSEGILIYISIILTLTLFIEWDIRRMKNN